MKTAIDNLRSVNIATAIASGNDYYTNAVAAPGCISTAITVGATDNSDAVANFSNSSAQVDLYAPGVSVYAAVPGGGYGYKSGTSMATPHVVGSIATMKAANPALTVAQEESFLGSSGPLVTDSKSSLQRHRINVLQAMGQETISLTNDVARDLRNPIPYDHRFATQSTNGYWSAVAIRPPSGSDYDLTVYDNSNVTGYLADQHLWRRHDRLRRSGQQQWAARVPRRDVPPRAQVRRVWSLPDRVRQRRLRAQRLDEQHLDGLLRGHRDPGHFPGQRSAHLLPGGSLERGPGPGAVADGVDGRNPDDLRPGSRLVGGGLEQRRCGLRGGFLLHLLGVTVRRAGASEPCWVRQLHAVPRHVSTRRVGDHQQR